FDLSSRRHAACLRPPARRTTMDDRSAPAPTVDTILAHLLLGGATELDAARDPIWIVGHAPSGVWFELHHWLQQGYSVARRPRPNQPVERLGVFPTWEAAVACALGA